MASLFSEIEEFDFKSSTITLDRIDLFYASYSLQNNLVS